MKNLSILLLVIAMLCPADMYAGITGILKGKVTDTNGEPMVGATVRVMGTQRGAIVKEKDGSFTIVNIPSGEWTVKATFVGKQDAEKKVLISADQTTYADFTLGDEGGAQTKEIEIIGSRDLVRKESIGSKQTFSSSDVTDIAVEGLTGVVAMSAGVSNSGNGWNIRGSRSTETQILVDGINVGNSFTGGFGVSGTAYYPMVSAFATEEVQVLTGGFSAEHGEVMGGVVNSMVKTGRDDKYEGFLRFRTDMPALNGSQFSGLEIAREGRDLVIEDVGEGHKYQGANTNSYEFGVGGPIPLLSKSTFYITGNYLHEDYRTNSYDVYDPEGNNIGLMDNNETWKKNITGRLKFAITSDIELTLGAMFGMSNFEVGDWSWLYADEVGMIDNVSNGVPENIAKQNVWNQVVSNYFARITHTLTSASFYELRIGNNTNNDEYGRRATFGQPGFFSGFDIEVPTDVRKPSPSNSELIPGQDKVIDIYTYLSDFRDSEDGYLRQFYPIRNPLTGYWEGAGNSSGTKNAYGLQSYFMTSGSDGGFQFRNSNDWQVQGSYSISLDEGDFSHNIKTGFDFRIWELHRHYNGNPDASNPFYDIYTDKWGGNLYTLDPDVYERTSKPFKPVKIAAYVQDQISYKGIVFTPGFRIDYFNPNSEYRVDSPYFVSIAADSGFADVDAKFQVSPRIMVMYPITERSQLSLAYGIYFKTPELQNMYDKFYLAELRSGDILGNPNMEAQRTNSYQVSYQNQLTDEFVLELSAYYKDIYNQLGVQYYKATPTPFYQYTVSEYGNSKGIEATFRKLNFNHVGLLLNYTLGFVTGTSNSPAANAGISIDPYTDLPMFPLATYPQNWDVRHRVSANLDINWGNDEGPSIGGIQLLENSNFIFTGNYRSGYPYTRTDANGTPLSERNSERQPSFWEIDFRFQKLFRLQDWFGEGAGATSIQFFVDINNLLNRTAVTALYSATGDPDDNGRVLEVQVGNFSPTTFYENADFANPTTYAPSQYDAYGRRLYSPNADYDNNGLVTQAEKYESYVNYAEDALSFRANYQIPRTVFVGVNVRF